MTGVWLLVSLGATFLLEISMRYITLASRMWSVECPGTLIAREADKTMASNKYLDIETVFNSVPIEGKDISLYNILLVMSYSKGTPTIGINVCTFAFG